MRCGFFLAVATVCGCVCAPTSGDITFSHDVGTVGVTRPPANAVFQEVFESFSHARFGEKLVSYSDDVDLVKIHGYVERDVRAVWRLAQYDL